MYSSQTKYVCPTYFTCTDTLSFMSPLVTCRMSVFKSCETAGPLSHFWGRWRVVWQGSRFRSPEPGFPFAFHLPSVYQRSDPSFSLRDLAVDRSPPGATSSGHHGHGARIQLTWMALRSTCLHLKGCRSSLAIQYARGCRMDMRPVPQLATGYQISCCQMKAAV